MIKMQPENTIYSGLQYPLTEKLVRMSWSINIQQFTETYMFCVCFLGRCVCVLSSEWVLACINYTMLLCIPCALLNSSCAYLCEGVCMLCCADPQRHFE